MAIWAGIKSVARRIFARAASLAVFSFGPGLANAISQRGTRAIFEAYRRTPWFFVANNQLANERATASREHLQLFDGPNDDPERVAIKRLDPRYEVMRVLRRPVKTSAGLVMTARMRNKACALWFALAGAAFLGKIRSALTRKTVALVPISPMWILEYPTAAKRRYLVLVDPGAAPVEFTPEDIIPIIDPDVFNPYSPGIGPGSTLADELDTDDGAGEMARAVLQNLGVPSGLLVLEGIEKGEEKVVKKDWQQRFSGPAKAGQVEFARGKAQWIPLTQNLKDSQLLDVRKHLRDTFIQVNGMSPEIFGILDGSTRDSAYVARYHLALNAIVPWLDVLCDALQTHLVPEFGDEEDLFLGYSSPVPEDTELQLRCIATAPKAFRGRDARSVGRFPPDAELDDVVLGDQPQRGAQATPSQLPQSPASSLAHDPEFCKELARSPVFNRALARKAIEPVG